MNITKGKWKIERKVVIVIHNSGSDGSLVGTNICTNVHNEANQQLIADAGNTYQECNLLPSELLDQRYNVIKMLADLHATMHDSKATLASLNGKINEYYKSSQKILESC